MTDRQWHQIRAALTFWNAVAESSQVHPMEHPAVRGFFGGDNPTPLTPDEIFALACIQAPEDMELLTVSQVSKSSGISRDRLWKQLKKMDITPRKIYGKVFFYDSMELQRAALHVDKKTP